MPITATRTTTFKPLTGDQDGDGFVDFGDVLRHTLVISSTGTDATSVEVNDPLNGSTIFDQPGLPDVNVSPLAFNDTFTAVGNTLLEVGNATSQTGPQSTVVGNILSNDVDFFGDTFTISAFDATSANGGTVNVITTGPDAGSFTYISDDGFTGTDSFTYTIRDDGLGLRRRRRHHRARRRGVRRAPARRPRRGCVQHRGGRDSGRRPGSSTTLPPARCCSTPTATARGRRCNSRHWTPVSSSPPATSR